MRNRLRLGMVVLASAGVMLGCASPRVIQPTKASDHMLTCSQIYIEMDKAAEFKAKADKEKGLSGTNLAAALFFWPAIVGTYANANEAIAAANARVAVLQALANTKNCQNAQTAPNQAAAVFTASDVNHVNAFPLKSESAQSSYRDWLSKSKPKAIAIGSNGTLQATWGNKPSDKSLPSDPAERAMFLCEKQNGVRCELYAVDDEVVYKGGLQLPQSRGQARNNFSPRTAALITSSLEVRKNNPPTQFALITNVAALPIQTQSAREGYQKFLEQANPRVFAVASSGRWYSIWGTNPTDKSLPMDPLERVQYWCDRNGDTCKLYAVDNDVVWKN